VNEKHLLGEHFTALEQPHFCASEKAIRFMCAVNSAATEVK
jgi:hypothetical protein